MNDALARGCAARLFRKFEFLLHGKYYSSTVFAGQKVGIKQVSGKIWLVSFMLYNLGYFDHETCRLESIENPFAAKVLPMSSE